MQNIKTRVKTFVADHKDEIIAGTFITVAGAAYFAFIYKSMKSQEEALAEAETFIRAENAKGRSVYQLADGRLISVTHDE